VELYRIRFLLLIVVSFSGESLGKCM
jgi:hypothetical protein